jgi:hypothetical protein
MRVGRKTKSECVAVHISIGPCLGTKRRRGRASEKQTESVGYLSKDTVRPLIILARCIANKRSWAEQWRYSEEEFKPVTQIQC